MKTSKNFARVAVTAGLTAAMALGNVVAPAAMAFADTGSTVTFSDADYAASTTYKGIQIFKATVATAADGTKTVSNIAWASPDVEHAVVAAIQATDPEYASNLAQDAADWLNANAGVSGTNSEVASGNVLSKIAANLNGKGTWKTTSADGASLSGLEAGYWLFLTASAGTPEGKSTDAFTSPVYAVIDGVSSMTVTPKKGVPTVEKKILDDADAVGVADIKGSDKWKDVADSQIGQVVEYKLVGTVANNIATYDTYSYTFTDTLSAGLELTGTDDVKVAIDGEDVTDDAAITWAGNVLTVSFDNLLAAKDGITADSKVTVTYKAKLTAAAVIGGAGNGERWFVLAKDMAHNELIVTQGADHPLLYSKNALGTDATWISGEAPASEFDCTCKYRYRQPDQAVHVSVRENGQVLVTAEERQRAVTPGQSMVFYRGEVCLGGAVCDAVPDAGQVG